MNTVGKNLKTLRKRSGMKQEDLAEKIHVTRQTISNYETGKSQPDIETLTMLAEALGTDINEVIYGVRKETVSADRHTSSLFMIAGMILSAVLGTVSYLYMNSLFLRGRNHFISLPESYVIRMAVLPYCLFAGLYFAGQLAQTGLNLHQGFRKSMHMISLVLTIMLSAFPAAASWSLMRSFRSGTQMPEQTVFVLMQLISHTGLILLCAAVLGFLTGISGYFSEQLLHGKNGKKKLAGIFAAVLFIPCLILGRFWYLCDSPFVYQLQKTDYRIRYHLPCEEMILKIYRRQDGELKSSTVYVPERDFHYADIMLSADYPVWAEIKPAAVGVRSEPDPELYEKIRGRSYIVPGEQEQIICIDENHSLNGSLNAYLEGSDDLILVTIKSIHTGSPQ